MKTVLVTGCSSGIGRATALHLADSGYRVLAGVRERDDGVSLQADAPASGDLIPVILDVTDRSAIDSAVEQAKDATDSDGLVAIVNNAGQPVTGPMEVLPIDGLRHELEVNLIGQVAVTQAFLPMLRATEGRVIFVTSIGGRVVLPFAGAYHASKFGLEAIAEAMRTELEGSGVMVSTIEPGVTDAEIWRKAEEQSTALLEELPAPQRNLYEADMDKFRERLQSVRDGDNMEPQKVAEKIETAITARHPSTRYPVGLPAWVAARIRPLVPDRAWDKLARRPFSG